MEQDSVGHVPPRTPQEEAIVEIWRDLVGCADVGVFDDFFALGGYSLLAPKVVARIRKTLGVDVSVMDVFQAPTVAELASAVAARSAAEPMVIGPRPPDAEPVLSFDQQRLWLESQLLPASAYNVHGRRRLIGPIDVAALDASLRAILGRHEALRTTFPTECGRPIQVVHELDEHWHISVADVSDAEDPSAAAVRLLDDEATRPFDLVRGPLFRCRLVVLGEADHLFAVTMHHIVSDAWSIGLFVRELLALYRVGGDLGRAGLPTLPMQYRDYAAWQRGFLTGDVLERLVGYWRTHLDGAPAALALPSAQWDSVVRGSRGERLFCALPAEETARVHDICRRHAVSPFMALLAIWSTVLARWSGQTDVVVGAPVAGRTDNGTDKLIGCFLNALPLRVDLSGDPTFADVFERVRQVALDGYAHADAPLDVLVEQMGIPRDPRRTPLFETVLNVMASPADEQFDGIEVEQLESPALFSKFDLVLNAQEVAGALQLRLDFNADRYQAMAAILVEQVRTLLRVAAEQPTARIFDCPLGAVAGIGPEGTPVAGSPSTPYQAIVARTRGDERVAVVDRDGHWSYRRLARAADRVARDLAGRDLDGSCHLGVVRRGCAAFVATLLGCMKAGTAFSIVDRAAPAPGFSAVLDAQPDGEAATGTVDLRPLFADGAGQNRDAVGEDCGNDSGAALDPSRDWAVDRFGITPRDRLAVLSGLSGHLLSALSTAFHAGAALVLADPPGVDTLAGLSTWLRTNAVTVLYLNPPVLRAMAGLEPAPDLSGLTCVFVDNAGDLLAHDVDGLRKLAPAARCAAMYRVGRDGRPAAVYELPADWRLATAPLRVPLGTALAGSTVELVNRAGQPAAPGEVAELCIGSYRTGELGRRRADGVLEFVRRVDEDSNLDLAETLAMLRDDPDVRDAVVTEDIDAHGRTRLLGYVCGPDPEVGGVTVRNRLLRRLPDRLVPAQIFVLDRLALTGKGEYDVSRLPVPDEDAGSADTYVAPRTPMERRLAEILQELLDADRVGVYDSFFELGGFSLLATQLTTRIRDEFDVDLPLRALFESPTIDELAQSILCGQGSRAGIDGLESLLDEVERVTGADMRRPETVA
jgi:non-ribosomal peptide synthetase component F/acyl carrier protein